MAKNKIVIYQVLPRLYGNMTAKTVVDGSIKQNGCGKFEDFTDERLKEISDLGATHIWYTGVLEHATKTDYSADGIDKDHPAVVKGRAGSPYAIKDYYDIDPDLATDVKNRVKEYEALIQRSHKSGLKVIQDFVPNHVARSYHSDAKPKGVKDLGAEDRTEVRFSRDNNFYYLPGQKFEGRFDLKSESDKEYEEQPAKVTGNDYYYNNPGIYDWYETVKLNYGVDYTNYGNLNTDPVPDTWIKMRDILLFWAKKKVDGFRCDMAEMVPVEFWEWAIPQVKAKYNDIIFIAETYNPSEYGKYIHRGGFDYLYDKVGLYDTLRGIVECRDSATSITNCWKKLEGLTSNMLNFLENHDEQRIASPQFAGDPIKGRPALLVSATVSDSPTMIYFGQEFGENAAGEKGFSGDDGRTTIFDYATVPSVQRKLKGKLTAAEKKLEEYYKKVLNICRTNDAIVNGKFFDLMYVNYHKPNFDMHRQYAYLRCSEKENLLIIANFRDDNFETEVNIPAHAFDIMELNEGKVTATDLLSGKKIKLELMRDADIKVTVPGQSGVVLSF